MIKKEAAKPRLPKNKKYMLVRYGKMNNLGLFEHNQSHVRREENRIIVKTNRGLELGCLIGNLVSYKGGQLKFSDKQIKEYFDKSEVDFSTVPVGKFIRYATSEDISEEKHLEKIAEEEMDCCRRWAEELGLSMKLVAADHIFGGERISNQNRNAANRLT
ncbi:MAG: PSP1 C-terminal domain-containing protein [Planctomycetota bacterium]